jgi:hypothetical protein
MTCFNQLMNQSLLMFIRINNDPNNFDFARMYNFSIACVRNFVPWNLPANLLNIMLPLGFIALESTDGTWNIFRGLSKNSLRDIERLHGIDDSSSENKLMFLTAKDKHAFTRFSTHCIANCMEQTPSVGAHFIYIQNCTSFTLAFTHYTNLPLYISG